MNAVSDPGQERGVPSRRSPSLRSPSRSLSRRGFLTRGALTAAALATAGLPLTGCAGSWTYNLRRSGAFEAALRHIRHATPGSLAADVVVTMPGTVTATMITAKKDQQVIATWRGGKVELGPPTPPAPVPDGVDPFALSDPVPRISDVRFEAQLANADPDLDSSELHYPELVSARFWRTDGHLKVQANLSEGQPPVVFDYLKGDLETDPPR